MKLRSQGPAEPESEPDNNAQKTKPEPEAPRLTTVEVVDVGTTLAAAQIPEYEKWVCTVLRCRAATVRARGFNAAGRAILDVRCHTSDIGVTAAARLRARLGGLTLMWREDAGAHLPIVNAM